MSANKFTEILTRESAAVVFVDQQVGLYSGVRDIALCSGLGEGRTRVQAAAGSDHNRSPEYVGTHNPRAGRGTSPRLGDHRPLDRERLGRTPRYSSNPSYRTQEVDRRRYLHRGVPCFSGDQCDCRGIRRLRRHRRIRRLLAGKARGGPA